MLTSAKPLTKNAAAPAPTGLVKDQAAVNAPVTTVAGMWISKQRPAGHGGLDLGVSGHKGYCQVAVR